MLPQMSVYTLHLCAAFTIVSQVAATNGMEEGQSEDIIVSLLQTNLEVSKVPKYLYAPGQQVSQTQTFVQTHRMQKHQNSGSKTQSEENKGPEATADSEASPAAGEKNTAAAPEAASAAAEKSTDATPEAAEKSTDAAPAAAEENTTAEKNTAAAPEAAPAAAEKNTTNASTSSNTTSSGDVNELEKTLQSIDQVLVRTDKIFSWAKNNANAEFYSQVDQLETSLRRLHVALHSSSTSSFCNKNAIDNTYLVGQWSNSETCGQKRLDDMAKTLNVAVKEIQQKISSIATATKKTWFWSDSSSEIDQDVMKMILMANMYVDKDTVACAPCSLESVDQSMVDSNVDIDTHQVYLFTALQWEIGGTLTVMVVVLFMCGSWGVLRLPKPDNLQSSLWILLVALLMLAIVTIYLYPYRQSSSFG